MPDVTLDKEIAVAIPTETYYEDQYREMAVEAELDGDSESARVLRYISGDEREHHDLLAAMQCRREPEQCQYGPAYEGDPKMDISNEFEPYTHTNPVSHQKGVYLRVCHNRIRSPRLEKFLDCMHDKLEGRHFRTGNPEEDTREVRAAFTVASHECSGQAGRAFQG